MTFDISDTLAPKSDQLDAVDLLGGPQTFTITDVTRHNAEQPINIHLAEFPRVWRPGKSMRRVLAACWGTDAKAYVGRRVTLYCDETVKFGNDVVGGTRISHLSHIDKVRKVPLMVSRGKAASFTVQPLKEAPPQKPQSTPQSSQEPTAEEVAACTDQAVLRAMWQVSGEERRNQIEARVAELATGKTDAQQPGDTDPWEAGQ